MEGGPTLIAISLREMLDDPDAVEAVQFLRQAYRTMDSIGPARAAFFRFGTGRILCPHCEETFRIHDSYAWTGRRHRGCGQKISVRYDLPSLPDERTQTPWGETLCAGCGKRLAAWGDTNKNHCGYCQHPLPPRPEEDPTPADALLTMQEAADILDVSHPFLVGLLEAEKIPYQRLGDRRRILFQDLMAFKAKADAARAEAVRQLTEEAQELDMGY